MSEFGTTFLNVLREAWVVLISALAAFVCLAVLSQALKTASAGALGARYWVWEAVSGGVGILLLVLFAFMGVPTLMQAVNGSIPSSTGCGPIVELGELAAKLIGALAALRMLKSTIMVAASAMVGGNASLSGALLEAGEAIFGLIIASIAVPLAIQFLGACS